MTRIAVVGAGGVGSLVGGQLANAGEDVTLVDLWPPHVDYLKSHDLHVQTTTADYHVKVRMIHIHEVAGLHRKFDVVFSATNGYDAGWAMMLIEPLLERSGWVLPLHDGLLEERIAAVVGRERVLGVVIDRLGVNVPEPGSVVRYMNAEHPTTFIVGELDGSRTKRLDESARLLGIAAGTITTDDIWGFHWSKLPRDCTRSPMTTLSGLDVGEAADNPLVRRASIGVIAEVVRVGVALGNDIKAETLMGVEAPLWLKAAEGDAASLAIVEKSVRDASQLNLPRGRASMAQHMSKRRRTEVEYLNGYVVEKARELGIPTPLNAAVVEAIQKMERGELEPSMRNIEEILAKGDAKTPASAAASKN